MQISFANLVVRAETLRRRAGRHGQRLLGDVHGFGGAHFQNEPTFRLERIPLGYLRAARREINIIQPILHINIKTNTIPVFEWPHFARSTRTPKSRWLCRTHIPPAGPGTRRPRVPCPVRRWPRGPRNLRPLSNTNYKSPMRCLVMLIKSARPYTLVLIFPPFVLELSHQSALLQFQHRLANQRTVRRIYIYKQQYIRNEIHNFKRYIYSTFLFCITH